MRGNIGAIRADIEREVREDDTGKTLNNG